MEKRREALQNFGNWHADKGVKLGIRPKKIGESQLAANPWCRIPKRLRSWRHQVPLTVGVKHTGKIKGLAESLCQRSPHPEASDYPTLKPAKDSNPHSSHLTGWKSW